MTDEVIMCLWVIWISYFVKACLSLLPIFLLCCFFFFLLIYRIFHCSAYNPFISYVLPSLFQFSFFKVFLWKKVINFNVIKIFISFYMVSVFHYLFKKCPKSWKYCPLLSSRNFVGFFLPVMFRSTVYLELFFGYGGRQSVKILFCF